MSQTLQEKNKTLLLEGFDVLFNKRDFIGAAKYWSPNYIQHSSHIEPGRDGLFNLVKSLPAGSKWEHGIMMAEGDYVMIHSRYSNPDGSAIVVVDIMRIKDRCVRGALGRDPACHLGDNRLGTGLGRGGLWQLHRQRGVPRAGFVSVRAEGRLSSASHSPHRPWR
jgi:predicted SnoaL-like aldol condensation-catalyzing enzyme